MPNLEELGLLGSHGFHAGASLLDEIEWPKGLRHLTLM
ncbi:unnamed protein product [Ectocarpus sp. 12 AP-2014]